MEESTGGEGWTRACGAWRLRVPQFLPWAFSCVQAAASPAQPGPASTQPRFSPAGRHSCTAPAPRAAGPSQSRAPCHRSCGAWQQAAQRNAGGRLSAVATVRGQRGQSQRAKARETTEGRVAAPAPVQAGLAAGKEGQSVGHLSSGVLHRPGANAMAAVMGGWAGAGVDGGGGQGAGWWARQAVVAQVSPWPNDPPGNHTHECISTLEPPLARNATARLEPRKTIADGPPARIPAYCSDQGLL